ncbi:Disease resistance protein (CC-NBS-LRR class) family [Rhynchospora pubera]|uniref:Disease resistance protein (CC-NBS-LRR class) family n=1 Tax=Rhynchospora pubera TaxID=906938 RepID=A0AAV8GZJ4_9POAL|nr:Disease resistance protein (CC-NBS-LRR class) family [Rhynchospora pubera]
MAEVLLNAVLGKLAEFAVEKAFQKFQPLHGIRKDVERLSRELIYIQEFIRDADEKHIVDHRQMRWVNDIMDIAYQIEDVVDIFRLECPEKLPGMRARLKRLAKRGTQFSFISQFQEEIRLIQERMSEIEDYKRKYRIDSLGKDKVPQYDPKLVPIGDLEVVGFATDRDNIVKCLLDETNRSLAVVSIVGPGGLGKTTLARKVCNSNDVLQRFGKSIWITISQKYDLLDVLRKIAQNLTIDPTGLHGIELGNLIWESLEKKRYLIVLDDVWTEELWVEIAKVMPDTKNGSRILITTRFANVAKRADTTYDHYELPVLDDKHSLELFLKKAIPKRHKFSDGPNAELYSLAKEFAAKCKGLPLALVVLGSLLSTRAYNFHAWNDLLQTMSWKDDGSECIKIIATSYDNLPFAKKLCFLYFAAFPEDKKIEAKLLQRLWVAERLIPQEERRTLEETAACFLEDLVQRSMVQASERFPDGSVKYCLVHDVLRDLAVQKAKEINFLMVCSKPDDWKYCTKARRVAIHYSDVNEPIGNYASPNVRSLLFFGDSSKLDFSKYKVLRVLGNIEGEVKLQSFKGSPHLRYLQLKTPWIRHNEPEFGKWVKSMNYLETLDLRSSRHGDLSRWIWHVKSVRHVLLSHITSGMTPGPATWGDLTNLQTLTDVKYNESWETLELPNITELRELGIDIDGIPEKEVKILLGKLKHVVCLKMERNIIDLEKIGTGFFPFYENLKSLVLINNRPKEMFPLVLGNDMLPPHLIELKLKGYKLGSDPMPVLEKLGSLNTLQIYGASKVENPLATQNNTSDMGSTRNALRIQCSAGGFVLLEELVLESLMLEEWKIEMGAMPKLKRLSVMNCAPLRVPPGLIHLDNLQYLNWATYTRTYLGAISNIFEQRPNLRNWSRDQFGDFVSIDSA